MRVLIVDDDELVVELLGKVCRAAGHDTRTRTPSPEQVLEMPLEHPFDLLITDLQMPKLDGVTLARHARRLQPSIFTMIITGHAREFAFEDVMEEGFTDLLFKPFHMAELRARIGLVELHKKTIDAYEIDRRKLETENVATISVLHSELDQLRRPKTR